MLVPAGAEGGGEVAVAGAVDLLDPGAEPGQGFLAFASVELPPAGGRDGLVSSSLSASPPAVRHCGEPGGQGGDLLVEAVEGVQQC